MKCPHCSTGLVQTRRHGLDVDLCDSCKGMWLSAAELDQLEDTVFDLDHQKGSLMLKSAPGTLKCPVCEQAMRGFEYRLYELAMDYCPEGHGYWLDAKEDQRVMQLMLKEEADTERRVLAEDAWKSNMRYLRHTSTIDKVVEVIKYAIGPKN